MDNSTKQSEGIEKAMAVIEKAIAQEFSQSERRAFVFGFLAGAYTERQAL